MSIYTVDFDQQNKTIISGSHDKSIKFFNKSTGIIQFEKVDAHNYEVGQIQLISDQNNNLLSSGFSQLILWQIDYDNKKLNKFKVLDQQHLNFTSVANNNRIILICEGEVKIYDKNLSIVQIINHNLNIEYTYRTRHVNSMNYILLKKYKIPSEILILKGI